MRLVKHARINNGLILLGLVLLLEELVTGGLQAKLNQISLRKHFYNYHGAQFQRERNTNIQRPVMKTSTNMK